VNYYRQKIVTAIRPNILLPICLKSRDELWGEEIIWSVVLHSCKTQFQILRKGHRLNVFESKETRKKYGQRRSRKLENVAQWVS